MTTRRSFLTLIGTLSMGVGGISSRASAGFVDWEARTRRVQASDGAPPGADAMNEALEMLAPYGPSFRGGLSNHGPMAAEALVSLGRHEEVVRWVERYRKRLEARSAPTARIEASNWREALGDSSRNRDWEEWFSQELAESPWRRVVGLWVPRLAPGMAAAGLHGVIRVGHAVCSLEVNENDVRLDELARALGYWASEYMTLTGEYSRPGKLAPSMALREVQRLPVEQRVGGGLITTEMKALNGFEPFGGTIDLIDPGAGKPSFMADLLASFAGIFINASLSSFEFLHAVTGAAAVTELLPNVKAEERAAVMAYTWQVTAGIYARYGRPGFVAEVDGGSSEASATDLVKLAGKARDEHTIKLAAACRREWDRNPDPRLLSAAMKRIGR